MAKGFKALISRIISSFQFCRSKSPSNFPQNPVPSFLQLSPNPVFIESPPATPPPVKPHRSSFKHLSSIFSPVGCGFGTQCTSEDELTESPEIKWDGTPCREIHNSSISGHSDNHLFPPPPPPSPLLRTSAKKKRQSKKKKATTRCRISTSSADSGLFGDDERDEEEEEIATLTPSFAAEGKVRESFAVVKKSEDPYEDFKRSMMEMIVEKQIFEAQELEQLLESFLTLNSRHHYRVIIQAFTNIWNTLFSSTS